MRLMLTLSLLMSAPVLTVPAMAEEMHADHDSHLAETEGLRILHAWAAATTGLEALVYLEIENTGPEDRLLTGAEVSGATAALVGYAYTDAKDTWTVLPQLAVPKGGDLHLEPKALALRLSGLTAPLVEAQDLEIALLFGSVHVPVHVEILPASATAHPHAGHQH